MSAILSSAMFSSAKTTTAFATPPSSYQRPNSLRLSSSPRLFGKKMLPRASSKVAIGDLPLVSSTEEESSDGSTGLMLEVVPRQNRVEDVQSEHWGSFHRRFGTKPRTGRKNLKDFFRKPSTIRKQDSLKVDGLWSSVVDAMWECTNPDVGERDEGDEWFDEVPLQRGGYLDIHQENGKWHFMEEVSSELESHLVD